jgi:hypothetical protein
VAASGSGADHPECERTTLPRVWGVLRADGPLRCIRPEHLALGPVNVSYGMKPSAMIPTGPAPKSTLPVHDRRRDWVPLAPPFPR